MIFFRLPLGGERFDQLMRDFELGVLEFDVDIAEAFHFADLVLVVHRVQDEAAFLRPQKDRVFAVVHHDLGDGDVLALVQRLLQQRVRTASGLLGHEVIRRLEVDGIDLIGFDEFEDLHRLGGLGLNALDLFRLDHDVFALAIFVSLDDFAALDDPLVHRAIELLLDAAEVVAMQHVEADVSTARAGKKTYRHRDETEGQITRPHRRWHNRPLRYEFRLGESRTWRRILTAEGGCATHAYTHMHIYDAEHLHPCCNCGAQV